MSDASFAPQALSLVHTVRPPREGANAPGAKPPLLILMHGVRSNERSMASLAGAFDPRFVVLSVRSPLTLGPDAFAWFHVAFTAQGPLIDADEARDGWTRVSAFIDEAVAAYSADPARVYLGGFSQGGIMTLATTLTVPEKVAGAVCMSGRLLPEVLPFAADASRLKDKPVLVVHGTADSVLGIDFGRNAKRELEARGVALTYQEFPMDHSVTPDSLGVVTRWLSGQLG